jgi:S-formylglutathione hydrolase FrmB
MKLDGWLEASIAGKTVHYYLPRNPSFLILDLHPVGEELASNNPVFTAELEKLGLACVSPMGKRSWWSDRICAEFDPKLSAEAFVLQELLPWIEAELRFTPPRIGLTGISMGGQGALRLGFKYPKLFPIVAGIASALEYHQWYGLGTPIDEMYPSSEHCRQDGAILQINPHQYPTAIWFACDPNDETWYRGNDRLHEKLRAIGIPHTADLDTEAGGHSWPYFNLMIPQMLEFIKAALSKENRRLL